MEGREGSGDECMFVPDMMMMVVVMTMTTFLGVAFFVMILQRTQSKTDKADFTDPILPLKINIKIQFCMCSFHGHIRCLSMNRFLEGILTISLVFVSQDGPRSDLSHG